MHFVSGQGGTNDTLFVPYCHPGKANFHNKFIRGKENAVKHISFFNKAACHVESWY
jgi:hypothetical protein